MVCNRVFVRRATINACGFVIGIQDTPRKITRGEVVNAIAHGPGWLDAPVHGSRRYVVRGWHQPVVIIDIQAPAELELAQVVQAGSPLGPGLGPGQGGQEHGCQDRDDGDDHQ